jgi:predicted outer membrane protein
MTRVFGMAAAATLALSVAAFAQDTKKPPAEHTMSGCVAKGASADTFVVNNTAEKGPKVIGVVSSTANLAPHVGHKVDITGTAVPNAEAEAAKPAPPKADHYMKLTAVKMVSATCP